MADTFGIFVSEPGTDITTAPANKTLMDTNHPFIKIDTQVKTSFQTLTLLIVNDPPEPAGAGHKYTQVYKFAHGYKYIPSIEVLYYVTNSPPLALYTEPYGQDTIELSAQTAFDYAILYASADATNVYFYIDKYNNGGLGSPNVLTGTNITITTHVFVEDCGF